MANQQQQAEWQARGFEYGVIHWRSLVEGTLSDQLSSTLSLTLGQLQELLNLGAIYDENSRLHNWSQLEKSYPAQKYLRIHTRPRRYDTQNFSMPVIFEDDDFLIVNKPAGLPCHPMVDNKLENLLQIMSQNRQEELFITHRLDVGTEGLIVLARNSKFQRHFNQQMAEGQIRKIYSLILEKAATFSPGMEFVHFMKVSPRAPKEISYRPSESALECRLRIAACAGRLLQVELITGRTHQIRAQLAYEGFPLAGDSMYGAKITAPRFWLRSREISFVDSKGVLRSFQIESFKDF